MNEFEKYFTKEELHHIFKYIWENNMRSIHCRLGSGLEISFYSNGKINLKKENEFYQIAQPLIDKDRNLDNLNKILENMCNNIKKEFKVLNINKSTNGFNASVKLDIDRIKYKKKVL
ncbi:MAG: hypothetical protein ACTSWR_02900 [Candidatus Helarchaeota archaeon]